MPVDEDTVWCVLGGGVAHPDGGWYLGGELEHELSEGQQVVAREQGAADTAHRLIPAPSNRHSPPKQLS